MTMRGERESRRRIFRGFSVRRSRDSGVTEKRRARDFRPERKGRARWVWNGAHARKTASECWRSRNYIKGFFLRKISRDFFPARSAVAMMVACAHSRKCPAEEGLT